MKSKSFTLFSISAAIIILTLVTATFWDYFNLGNNKVPLAIASTVAFGIVGLPKIRPFESWKNY